MRAVPRTGAEAATAAPHAVRAPAGVLRPTREGSGSFPGTPPASRGHALLPWIPNSTRTLGEPSPSLKGERAPSAAGKGR